MLIKLFAVFFFFGEILMFIIGHPWPLFNHKKHMFRVLAIWTLNLTLKFVNELLLWVLGLKILWLVG